MNEENKKPGAVLQIALDFVDMDRALKVAAEAASAGADWLEAGTPLIKSEGLDAVRALRKAFPCKTVIADMKIMDAGRIEVECAAKAGADVIDVLGAASDSTIIECVKAAANYGARVAVDTIGVSNPAERALQAEKMGADIVAVHSAIDEQMRAADVFSDLRIIASSAGIPIAVAGGITSENAADAVEAGASIVIVGGAVAKSADVKKAVEEILLSVRTGKRIETSLYKRTGEAGIREALLKVSTANLADAMHRQGVLSGIRQAFPGAGKIAGRAVTVRTCPGDWSKPVQAIDTAAPGDVIVIDAGGVNAAVWGELAAESAAGRKLSGVVVDGAVRDVEEIRKLGFPAYSKFVNPAAGEPRGLGEIGVPVSISGVRVFPGDWIAGDGDGVCVIPRADAAEVANRAMDVLERENRLRKEIQEGGTLSSVSHLLRWEKKGG